MWTNFDEYTENPIALAQLIEKAVDDALRAEGCSLKLTLPPEKEGHSQCWLDWLKDEF